jgi:hypothetical protein
VSPQRLRRRFPGLALAFPGRSTSHRRRPSRHACHRRRQLLFARAAPLSALKHTQRLLPDLVHSHARSISPAIPFPERSSSPERRRSLCHHQPPAPPLTRDPVLKKHHCDPLQLTDPSNFTFLHPSSIFHSASEFKAPPPLGLAIDPPIQSLFTPAKGTSSTTSTRRSFLQLLHCPPAP